MAALWAGFTAFVWYAFGTVPLQLAVAGQLGLTSAQSASGIFIVWFSGAVFSVAGVLGDRGRCRGFSVRGAPRTRRLLVDTARRCLRA